MGAVTGQMQKKVGSEVSSTIVKSQFYLIEGFWCKNPQWGKSKENQKNSKVDAGAIFHALKKYFRFWEISL